jgi:hypothetical protein
VVPSSGGADAGLFLLLTSTGVNFVEPGVALCRPNPEPSRARVQVSACQSFLCLFTVPLGLGNHGGVFNDQWVSGGRV